jgi:hypothetical protein
MEKMTVALIAAGLLAAIVGAIPPNPCPQQGVYHGLTHHYRCLDKEFVCRLDQWNFTDEQVCEYWCCYDNLGHFMFEYPNVRCTAWSENVDCCTLTGESYSEPPGGYCD